MKLYVKKKDGEATDETSKAFIMAILKDEDVKKAIRASLLSAKIKETEANPALSSEVQTRQAVAIKKEQVSKKLVCTAPYTAPKRQVSISDVMQHSLNFPKNKTSRV
eukprot:1772018-Ditylum_brightwellii.AAC.1